jgi:hypothetical protein
MGTMEPSKNQSDSDGNSGITVRLEAADGSIVTVTFADTRKPMNQREALALARKTMAEMAASLHETRPRPAFARSDDALFRAWAYR